LAVYSNELTLGTVGSACIGSDNHRETTKSLQIYYLFNSESIIPRSRTSTNWNDASSANGPLWVTRFMSDSAVREWRQRQTMRLRSCWRRTFWS